MIDLTFAIRKLQKYLGFTAVAAITLALGIGANMTALGHPGSGIVVDRRGRVYFADTGQGVWKIDERGRVCSHEGPAYHFMAIDLDGRLARTRWPVFHEPSTDIQRVGADPTLLVSSDFPLTTGRDGSLYYPDLGEDGILRVFQLTPSGERSELATLPTASDGRGLKWLNGLAAGPDGAIYFSENAAVRRITARGEVSTIASNIIVPDCLSPPGASPRLGPFLRGLLERQFLRVGAQFRQSQRDGSKAAQGKWSGDSRLTSPWENSCQLIPNPNGAALTAKLDIVTERIARTWIRRRTWRQLGSARWAYRLTIGRVPRATLRGFTASLALGCLRAVPLGLPNQQSPTAVSIPSNIAEGHSRNSSGEFVLHFARISSLVTNHLSLLLILLNGAIA